MKTEGDETILYVNQYYQKNLSTGEETSHYYLGGKEVAFCKGGTLTYVHQDFQGGTNMTTDASGAEVSKVAYFPFGTLRSQSGQLDTDKLFTGQRLDQTGLYYYWARYYDAGIGRFISPDTVVPDPFDPQSLNRYSYCLNNPLRYVDPSGHQYDFTQGDIEQWVIDHPDDPHLTDKGREFASQVALEKGPQGNVPWDWVDIDHPKWEGTLTSNFIGLMHFGDVVELEHQDAPLKGIKDTYVVTEKPGHRVEGVGWLWGPDRDSIVPRYDYQYPWFVFPGNWANYTATIYHNGSKIASYTQIGKENPSAWSKVEFTATWVPTPSTWMTIIQTGYSVIKWGVTGYPPWKLPSGKPGSSYITIY